MFLIKVVRDARSFDYKVWENKQDGFNNNYKNNSIDQLSLWSGSKVVFCCHCQSVANYCFGKERPGDTVSYGDSIAPGKFAVRCFVSPRMFHGQPHAIINAWDIDGQFIDNSAMQVTKDGYQNGRWLIHDKCNVVTGKDTTFAWSAGCIILSSADLAKLGVSLHAIGVQAGDVIYGLMA